MKAREWNKILIYSNVYTSKCICVRTKRRKQIKMEIRLSILLVRRSVIGQGGVVQHKVVANNFVELQRTANLIASSLLHLHILLHRYVEFAWRVCGNR